MSAGHEKLRYAGGGVTVITKNHVESDSLVKCADEILKGHDGQSKFRLYEYY